MSWLVCYNFADMKHIIELNQMVSNQQKWKTRIFHCFRLIFKCVWMDVMIKFIVIGVLLHLFTLYWQLNNWIGKNKINRPHIFIFIAFHFIVIIRKLWCTNTCANFIADLWWDEDIILWKKDLNQAEMVQNKTKVKIHSRNM